MLISLALIYVTGLNQQQREDKSDSSIEVQKSEEQTKQMSVGDDLFCDEFQEIVIEEGIVYEGAIVYEQSGQGLLSTGDAALDAEVIGEFILDILESGNTEPGRDLFGSDDYFIKFQNQEWNRLGNGWTANRYYDCYHTYVTKDAGYVGFTYYIYPNFAEMKTKAAKAVTFQCSIGVGDGKLYDTKLEAYDMTEEEYQTAREKKGDRITFVENGEIIGGGGYIEIPGQDIGEDTKYIYTYKDMGTNQLVDLLMEDLRAGNIENGEVGKFLIEQDNTWLSEIADEIRDNTKDGWRLGEKYDFYYMNQNERVGFIHYRYYFYWNHPDEKNEKVLVTDAWIREEGIQEMQLHWFLTRRHDDSEAKQDIESYAHIDEADDIAAFLEVDWTDSDILMQNHTIQPEDSARGWEFAVADIDFDGTQEMLITFTSNHCGTNSLYIYKQQEGKVFSYTDTIATPDRYMSCGIDYKKISPYMDIELMDAYMNSDHEYRYLSLDCSSFGGDIHGGIYTVVLYETLLEQDSIPMEIARIEYCGPEERTELFFLGEKVYEAGRLRDMIAFYMEGYAQVEIEYRTVEKTFARDIVGKSEEERTKENQELCESILKLAELDQEMENPYFYNKKQVSLQVHAEYHNGIEFVDEIAEAEVCGVKIYEHGCVYKMTIYIEPFMSSWYFKSGEPMNIYFYVTADKIYRILPYAQPEPGGKSIDLYDDDNLLTETLDTEEKLQDNSILVCQEEELQQEYSSITKDGNKIIYYLSETKVNGEPGGEDLFVWEQGKGLIEFGTGFGPGPMDVHIDEIQEAIEDK